MVIMNMMEEIRKTPHYKIGYLREAMIIALAMLKNGSVEEAINCLQNTLNKVKGVDDGNYL